MDLTLCTNVLVERVRAIKGGGVAIYGTAHCISALLRIFLKIKQNFIRGAQTFGIGVYQVSYCNISENSTSNTGKEAINVEDSSYVKINDNTCKWDAGTWDGF